jgi:hypothetical protein
MIDVLKIRSMAALLALISMAALLALTALVMPARAADPVFPTGSRVGMVPPDGMTPSETFEGFGDQQKNAAILITTLPADAYESLEKTGVPDSLRKEGFTIDRREPIELKDGKGFLITGTEIADKTRFRKWLLVAALADVTALVSVQVPEQDQAYSERALRSALATLTVRADVPDAERLSRLPFTVGELAGFRISDVMPGRAVMLIDARPGSEQDSSGFTLNARLMAAAMPDGPVEPGERASFARMTFDSIVGIKDVHVQMAEPLRMGGQPGFQIVAQAKDANTGTDLMVAQWLRFGSGGYLEIVGMGRADVWNEEFPRLRAIRDSIDPK